MSTASAARASTARRAALASLVGTTIEWFDFFIYGTAAALVFGDLFFPAADGHSARLASFATLGVAFLARPIGAAVFGHVGDRLGRRSTLVTTLAVMGTSTGLIGCLPTYDTIGVWAPVLLIVLRLVQGAAVGGEWGGAVLMSVEHAPASKVRLYGAAPQLGSPLGLVLSTAVMSAVTSLPESSLLSWGWRVPFLAGFVLVLVGLVIRLGVEESADFQQLKEDGGTSRLPLRDVCTRAWRQLLIGTGLQASVNVIFYVISVFFLSYATDALGFERTTALLIVSFAATVDLLALPLFAHLSDRFGAHRVFTAGVAFTVIAAYPFFGLVDSGDTLVVTLTVTLMMVGAHATTYAVISSMTAGLFDSGVRYSGTSLSNALGGLAFSAPTPLIAEAVIGPDGTRWWPLGIMAIVAGAVSLIAVRAMTRTAPDHDGHDPAGNALAAGATPQSGSPV
ncbi:MFS transporter [Streptomyces sp. NPDC047017]|uniref:MFS transporter n=1 Tax=Streptomyces sp. NPDC047017 TaxID=3155024 RepID=UPI0034076C3D